MKIRSKSDFQDYIERERAWRRHELTNIYSMICQSRKAHRHTLLRSGILLLYSHWEGYVKKVCEAFFSYLNFQALPYSELGDNFKALGLISEYRGNFPVNKFDSYLTAVDFVSNGSSMKGFKLDISKNVDTRSNLNSDVLQELTSKVGIDCSVFQANKVYIDGRLLKYRNAIAHGERTDNNPEYQIEMEDFNVLYRKINSLIDQFENLVINHIETETYRVKLP